ncbi:MAG: UDP-N-acetylmuramate dehydrogenase [Defluviitaleaceae bacterium]|nr:UDP-N-acetylmuramate dehydrogenase [Defluviitaleaceae bacterium]
MLINAVGEDNVCQNEAMLKHTTFKIGGKADFFVMPQTAEHLHGIIKGCKENNIPYLILGNGSNLLMHDDGFFGVVISLLGLNKISIENGVITAQAGASMKSLAEFALAHGITGFEFCHGIPGSVGGGVYMNAGAYEGEMSQIFVSATCLDGQNSFQEITSAHADFSYRKSFAQTNGLIVVSAAFKGEQGDKPSIAAKMEELQEKRESRQPLEMPSAGSIFKRPEGHFAGKLIMDAGLKGYSVGGAMVSDKHCGFIVNKGDATCRDVLELIHHIQQTVQAKFGVLLETEVKVLGGRNEN